MRISDWSSDVCSSDLKHKARIAELASQARQIIEDKKVPCSGELEYRFTDGAIRTLLINESLRRQLASGALVIARLGDHYELLPRAAADKVRERDAGIDRKSTRLNSSH